MPPKSAWATQVDDEEESGKASLAPLPAAFAAEPEAAFPSLGDAARVVESKAERKKKQQKMSLADFNSLGKGGGGGGGGSSSSGKYQVGAARSRAVQKEQDDILSRLPRGPRADREPDEGPGLGGGFQGYGGDRGGSKFGDGDGGREGGRSERRGMWGDRDRSEAGSQVSDDGPSRADATDDWGASRKFTPTTDADRRSGGGGFGDRRGGGFGDRDSERRGGFGDRDRDRDRDEVDDGPSRADTSDDWGKNRAPLPPAEPSRGGAFGERRSGGGFADRDGFGSRREGDLFSGSARADEAGTWGRSSGGGGGGGDSWGAPRRPDPDAGLPSGDRPRLKLAPRTKPVPVIKVETPPPEEQPKAAEEPEAEQEPKPRVPRANPFGGARPREEVLAQKATSAAGSSAGSVTGSATDEKAQPASSESASAEPAAAGESGTAEASHEPTPEAEQPPAEEPLAPQPTPVEPVPEAAGTSKPVEQTLQEAEEQLSKLSTAEAN